MAYIHALSPEPPQLRIDNVPGERLQPTIGAEAASLLQVLIAAHRPKLVLEIGTSLGYSAIAIGRAAASYGGHVISVESNARLADAARQNVAAESLEATVRIETADASQFIRNVKGPLGLILQDGGKEQYVPMLDGLVELLEPNGLLVSDDVLFPVMQLPPQVKHWADAMDAYNHALKNHRRLRTIWLPIGDGVAISVKVE